MHIPATKVVLPVLVPVMMLMGCASTEGQSTLINDPIEPVNRVSHSINKGLDSVLLRPAAKGFSALPERVQTGMGNAASNLAEPLDAVNFTLQGEAKPALDAIARVTLNSTLGLFGLIDLAGALGIKNSDTDFGETLHSWGSGEGAYVELPVLGPSTTRDTVGKVVDAVLNPLDLLDSGISDDQQLAASAVGAVETRSDMMDPLDAVLYDSPDSYVAARAAWVQARRAALGNGETEADDLIDLY